MVKGVSKRVIVVKSPDVRLFEEAIFIVKEDVFKESGVSSDEVLREAQRVADGYLRNSGKKEKLQITWLRLISAAAGAGIVGCVWLVAHLIGWC